MMLCILLLSVLPLSLAYNGKATWYNNPNYNPGSCGFGFSDSDFIAALSGDMMKGYKAPYCNMMAKVHYKGKSVTVKIVDTCPTCEKTSLDLSPAAFQALEDPDVGILDIEWDFIEEGANTEEKESMEKFQEPFKKEENHVQEKHQDHEPHTETWNKESDKNHDHHSAKKSIASSELKEGKATWTGTPDEGAGSCGIPYTEYDYVAVVSELYGSSLCNKEVLVYVKNKSVKVKVVDTCHDCDANELVLSKNLFKVFENLETGIIDAKWQIMDHSPSENTANDKPSKEKDSKENESKEQKSDDRHKSDETRSNQPNENHQPIEANQEKADTKAPSETIATMTQEKETSATSTSTAITKNRPYSYGSGTNLDESSKLMELEEVGSSRQRTTIDIENRKTVYDDLHTIDWMKDWKRDHQRHIKFRKTTHTFFEKLYYNSQSWILILVAGISIGLVGGWIDLASAWLTDTKLGYCRQQWYASKKICCKIMADKYGYCDDWIDWSYAFIWLRNLSLVNWLFYVVFSTAFGYFATIIVTNISLYASGSGTPEIKTILGGFIIKGFLGLRTLLAKATSIPLVVASGLTVGKEGPMLHVAACIGSIFPRFFSKYRDNQARKREVLSAAIAAGIAVSFGAPMGGVLFSLEEMSSFFPPKTMIRAFFCALVSSVTLQMIDPYRGKRVLYQVTVIRDWDFHEIFYFVLLGVFGGLSGALFIRANMMAQNIYRSNFVNRISPVRLVLLLSFFTSLIGFLNTFTRMDSSELLELLFQECEESKADSLCSDYFAWNLFSLIFALCFKMIMAVVSIGIEVPAGIFIPSMVWGGLFGRILGMIREHMNSSQVYNATPGMYALLGAFSALGGITRLTLSLTIIMFELTGTLNYIIPCMICLTVSKLVGDIFGKNGYIEMKIQEKNYPFLDPTQEISVTLHAKDIMTPLSNLVYLPEQGLRVKDLEATLHQSKFQGYPVILSIQEPHIIGYITRRDIEYALSAIKRTHGIDPNALVFFKEVESDNEHSSESPSLVKDIPESLISDYSSQFIHTPSRIVDLSGRMDSTPLGIDPNLPVDTVIDIFTKLGHRIILVKVNGRLQGLITKKDVLKEIGR